MKTRSEMTKIPDRLSAVVSADGKPLEGLLIMLSLEMTSKNTFHIVFGPTDKKGRVEVSWREIESEAARSRKMFSLDYDGLSSFNGKIIVAPMAQDQLKSALGAYDIYHEFSDYPSSYREKLETARKILDRLGPKLLAVKVTVRPSNDKIRIEAQTVMARSNGLPQRKRSG